MSRFLFDLPSYLVDRSGHPTYGLEILSDFDRSPITIGNLLGDGLQGVFRDPMTSHLPDPKDAAIDLDSEAGVSVNAMHCAIEARRYANSVNEKLSKEAVIATCKNHLCPVTDDPLHHSELEVWVGANLGWDLYDYAKDESFKSY